MRKLTLFFAFLLSVMGVTQTWAQKLLPYSYGFEEADEIANWTLTACKDNSNGYGTGRYHLGTSSTHDGSSYVFRFYYNTNPPQYLISPELVNSSTGVDVSFYYYGASTSETFKVGYSTTDTETSSFIFGEEIAANKMWNLYEESFPSETKYIAISYTANNKYYLYLDEFQVTASESFKSPKNLTLSGCTSNSATLSWTNGNDETAWNIKYSTVQGFDPTTEGTIISVSTNPFTLTGLIAETTYYARVQADYGDGNVSGWSEEIGFIPTDALDLTVNDGTQLNYYVPFNTNYCDENNTGSQFIIPASSLISMVGRQITKLTFYNNSSTVNFGSPKFKVYLKEVPETAFSSATFDYSDMEQVYLGTVSVSNGKMEIVLDTPFDYAEGNLKVGFDIDSKDGCQSSKWYGVSSSNAAIYKYGNSNYKAVESFLPKTTITTLPGEVPIAPTALIASNLTAISAELTWTNGGSETKWQLSYSTERGNHDITTEVFTDKPYTLTNLIPGTTYYVSIRAKKGIYSEWSEEINFTTSSVVAVTGVSVDPTSWEMLAGEIKTLTATVTPNDATFSTVTWESDNTSVATVDNEGNVTAVAPGTAMITVKSTDNTSIKAMSTITVTAPFAPTALSVKDITSTTASLTWTNGSTESAWQVKYGTESGNLDTESGDITIKPYAIVGLAANTTYYISVRSKLGTAYSDWSTEAEFTTTAVGPEPGGTTTVIEDFESGWSYKTSNPYTLNGIKDGWGYANGYSNLKIKSGTEVSQSADGHGLFTSTGYNSGYLVTPAVKPGTTISFCARVFDSTISGKKKVQLYKATKNGDAYSVNSEVCYADVGMTSNWVLSTSSVISEGGYVAILLNNAAIDYIEYTVGATTVSVTTDNYGYATYSNANKVLDLTTVNLPEGLEAYKASVNGTKVNLTKLDQIVPANTGILLKGAAYTEYNIATVPEGITVEGNDFRATDGTTVVTSSDDTFIFVMKKNQPELTFGKYIGTAPLPANKAYLEVPASNFDGGNARLSFTFEEGAATGIFTMENTSRTNDGTIYNLQGQKVQNATKGLYIINGKKVVMK